MAKKPEAIRFCNRCNAKKASNGPCEKCGCQEFRIGHGR